MKHYTSKLSNYDDLVSLDTFGFRGEALSSLCALSKFHIITARDGEAPKGKRLDFEISGKLKGTTVAACQKGTTVAILDLFHNLPVRRRELEKNIKREYSKVLGILHAYACISTKVRIAVSNQMAKGYVLQQSLLGLGSDWSMQEEARGFFDQVKPNNQGEHCKRIWSENYPCTNCAEP